MASHLESLPNEILSQILSSFPTAGLLPLLTVSRSLHELVFRVLHHRLLFTWPLPSHGLILEKYHPSERWTEPYLHCSYLGMVGGLSREIAYEPSYASCVSHAEKCAKMKGVYSRFKPLRRYDEVTRRRPLMGVVSVDHSSASTARPADDASLSGLKVEHTLHLDSHELFTQLCLSTSLVKLGPVSSVFPSVSEASSGVIRVWRPWLREQADLTRKYDESLTPDLNDDLCQAEDDRNILWVDWKRDVGLRVRVRERNSYVVGQVPVDNDDERPVSYAVEIEELVFRTTRLVLAIEKSLDDQQGASGKAMIFGSLDSSSVAGNPPPAPVPA